MAKRLFGTDGIRGEAGEYPLDAPTVYAAGLALAKALGCEGGRALIGLDTRESGPLLAELIAGGLRAGGVESSFAGVVPTAAVSLLTEQGGFQAGIMISASHNPYQDNGIKVFGPDGFKLPDDMEARVEDEILELVAQGVQPAPLPLQADATHEERYFQHLLAAGEPLERLKPLRLIVDCSNGAAYRIAARFFAALGMQAEILAAEPTGRNINVDCGSLHMQVLCDRVLESRADLGVAFDGDADRALFVADDGEIVDGDGILALTARHLQSIGRLPGNRIVSTVMANMGLERSLEEVGISMTRSAVGDKYVLERMLAEGATLGGEQSGHIIFKEFAHTGDGLLTARMLLEALSAADMPLSGLRRILTPFPQKLINIRVKAKPTIETVPALAQAVAAGEAELGRSGRVLVRYSGTEPLLRIMVEADHESLVEEHCGRLEKVFRAELGV